MTPLVFYYDLGSPYAYLTAERIDDVLPGPVTWQPLSLGGIFKLTGRSSWGLSDGREAGMAEIERRAERYGLPAIVWPHGWPGHYLMAMRAATFAFRESAGREYTMSAFRLAFREGRDLSLPENVLEAVDRAGLDPDDVERATQDPEIKQELK